MAQATEQALQCVVSGLLDPCLDIAQHRDLYGKRVLLRVDFNVPTDESTGLVTDASRVTAVIPTVQLLLGHKAKVILASHFGRPDPKKQTHEEMQRLYSLRPVAALLQQELGGAFQGLAPNCVGPQAEAAVASLQDGQVLLLENTRFHPGDTANSAAFAAQLATLCDVFVNDAFGVVHRDQGSVTGVAHLVPEVYPGPLIRAELRAMAQHVLYHPARPLGVVLGGAKVADKIGVIAALIEIADVVLVGGRMAFTLLAAQGVSVGSTQVEADWLEPCRAMIARAAVRGTRLLLPVDVLWSSSLTGPVDTASTATTVTTQPPVPSAVAAAAATPQQTSWAADQQVASTGVQVLTTTCCTESSPCIPAGRYGVDIGPETMKAFTEEILRCRTVFWNGPMGKFEVPQFSAGTTAVARALDEASQQGAITVVGGGDSVAAVMAAGLDAHITHISTGGGACLELIEGKGMPGLRALLRKPPSGNNHVSSGDPGLPADPAAPAPSAGAGCCGAGPEVAGCAPLGKTSPCCGAAGGSGDR